MDNLNKFTKVKFNIMESSMDKVVISSKKSLFTKDKLKITDMMVNV